MLRAAYQLFCERGYPATTMNAIASEAGVAVQTLYFTFHTKGAILSEVLGAAVVGFERWSGPPPTTIDFGDSKILRASLPWYEAFEQEPDARRALALFVERGMEPFSRTAPLVAAMHAAAADPDVRAVVELGEQRRHISWAQAVRQLSKKSGGLRRGLGVARATDLFYVIFGNETIHALNKLGWSERDCSRWFIDVLSEQLLGPR